MPGEPVAEFAARTTTDVLSTLDTQLKDVDVVRVIESRPLSRSKRWALVDVLERAR